MAVGEIENNYNKEEGYKLYLMLIKTLIVVKHILIVIEVTNKIMKKQRTNQ